MAATFIGSLVADMSANSAAFGRDMRDSARTLRSAGANMNRTLGSIDRGFQRVRRGIANSTRNMFGFRGAVAAVASPAAIGYLIRQSMLATDELAKTADSIDMSVESLSALEFQASQTGLSFDQISTALRFFIRGVGDLEARTGTLFTFLSRYDEGLLNNLRNAENQEEALRILADAIEAEEDATVRASLASAAFGRQGARLVRTFREGASGIDEYRRRAEGLELIMREDLARSVEETNDQIDALTRQMQMEFNVAVAENAEEILTLVQLFGDLKTAIVEAAGAYVRWVEDLPIGNWIAQLRGLPTEPIASREERNAALGELTGRLGEGERLTVGEVRDYFDRFFVDDQMGRRELRERVDISPYDRDSLVLSRSQQARLLEAATGFLTLSIESTPPTRPDPPQTDEGSGGLPTDPPDDPPGSLVGEPDTAFLNFLERMQTAVEEVRAEQEALAGEAESYFLATRTAAEGYASELERINELEAGGFFADLGGAETAGRARIQILTDLAEASGNLQAAFEELQRLSEEEIISAAQFKEARAELMGLVEDIENIETIYDDIRKSGEGVFRTALDEVHDFSMGMQDLDETVGDVITSIRSHFQRLMLQRFLIQPLENAFNSFLGNISTGKGGGLGSIFGGGGKSAGKANVPGFARGGSGVVGGVGGTDSKLVMFRATPGESVDIQTPSQQREAARGSAGRSGDVIVNFNFPAGSDAQSIRRARGEIAADIGRVVRQAQRNL